ncbi:MAG: DnaA/Hda family protein, partial [Acidimicrobiia bacterium]|nr:DnaA/Hda family protein [Acidimicrobiia bacterium]
MEAHSHAESWDRFRDSLRDRVTPITWQTWLENLKPQSIENGTIYLAAPSEFHLRWVNDKYRRLVEEAATEAFGSDVRLVMDATEELPSFQHDEDDDEAAEEGYRVPLDPSSPPAPTDDVDPDTGAVGRYSFENFVVGPSNRFAYAASMAIAEQPGGQYNPLFIYGSAGLGKTHLLQAVAL